MPSPAQQAGSGEQSLGRPLGTLPRLTLRGVLFLAAAVILVILSRVLLIRELAFAGSLLFTLVLLGYLLVALRRPRIEAVRRIEPEIVEAGTPANVTLTFANHGWSRSPSGRWADPVDGAGVSPDALLPAIRGFRRTVDLVPPTATVGYDIVSPVRGEHVFGPVSLRLTDPFGVATQVVVFGRAERVTVTPRTLPIERSTVELAPGVGNERFAGRVAQSGDVDVLTRKYQTGDSMRRVNWPATARYGELMVRQDDQNGVRDTIVVVDTDPTAYPGSDVVLRRQDDVEWAIAAACSIGVAALSDGYSVGLASVFDDRRDARWGVRIYAAGETSRLLLDGATIARRAVAARDGELTGLLAAEYGPQGGGPTMYALLGSRSDPSAIAGLPSLGSSAFALVVVPAAEHPAQPALDLEQELLAAGWRVRLVVAGDSLQDAWRSLVTGKERA